MTPDFIDTLRRRLLAFYDARSRDLPWRREADPYRVWVSEVMLQQTRVEAVIPYYERWMRRFPTLEALAEADVDDVLREWQGLGYYARARNLHRAARLVRERYHGQIPGDVEALRRLPGVGEYTAGAIASIAFGIPAPAIDGNVRRVFSRLLDDPDPAPAELRRVVAALVPEDRPGDFNQALMELGATVCTPRSPACDRCPVAAVCRARTNGTVAERPRPKPKKALPEDDVATAVIVSPSGRILVVRRPEEGLLGGMWEFPGTAVRAGETPAEAARRAAENALAAEEAREEEALAAAHDGRSATRTVSADAAGRTWASGATAPADLETAPDARETASRPEPREAAPASETSAALVPEPLGTVVHAFSHRRTTYHAFRFDLDYEPPDHGPAPSSAGRAWVTPADTAGYALSAAQLRVLALAFEDGGR